MALYIRSTKRLLRLYIKIFRAFPHQWLLHIIGPLNNDERFTRGGYHTGHEEEHEIVRMKRTAQNGAHTIQHIDRFETASLLCYASGAALLGKHVITHVDATKKTN